MEGKVRSLSKLLRDNLGMVMQGVGVVVPLFATYDKESSDSFKLFFYDAMGAQLTQPLLLPAVQERRRSGACSITRKLGAKPLRDTRPGRGNPAGAESAGHTLRRRAKAPWEQTPRGFNIYQPSPY